MPNNTIAERIQQLKQIKDQKEQEAKLLHTAKVDLAERLTAEAKSVRDSLPDIELVLVCVNDDGASVRFTVSVAKIGDPIVGIARMMEGQIASDLGGLLHTSYDHCTRKRVGEPGEWDNAVADTLWMLATQESPPNEW